MKDVETIDYLKIATDSNGSNDDWWHDLSFEGQAGIEHGLENLHFYIVETCKSPITSKRYIEGIFSKINIVVAFSRKPSNHLTEIYFTVWI